MKIGCRVIFSEKGVIIAQFSEVNGDAKPRKEIKELHYVDLPYGAINHETHSLVGIDPDTQKPILEKIEREKTPEEQYIEAMENEILLQAEKDIGGIL